MNKLQNISLADVTPQNLAKDENISALIKSIDKQLNSVSSSIPENLILPRIDDLNENVLDILAWHLHVDFYDLAGNVNMKRESVKNSLLWHMKKGTEWSIHEALRLIGIKADYHPWYETGGEPYTFTLDAIVTDEYYKTAPGNQITENIRRVVEEAKAARSYLAGLITTIEQDDNLGLYIAHAKLISGNQRVQFMRPKSPKPKNLYIALSYDLNVSRKIYPQRPSVPASKFYTANVSHEYIYAEFGVDLETMHELLMMFEKRIFDRLNEHEQKIMHEIDTLNKELTLKIENRHGELKLEIENKHDELKAQIKEINDLLRWQ